MVAPSQRAEPSLAAAVLLERADGRVLLVKPGSGAPRRWTLPLEPAKDTEVAEQALVRLLSGRLHIQSELVEFTDTISIDEPGKPGVIANVFTCHEWQGEPRYAASDFSDAVWANPGAPARDLDIRPEVRAWLLERYGPHAGRWHDPVALQAELAEARAELLRAFEETPWDERDRKLDGDWTPLDVLAHCATAEAYYASEARRLLEIAGHTWRPFSPEQYEAERLGRTPLAEEAEYARLEAVQAATLAWLEHLNSGDLGQYGNHRSRGAVRVGERVDKIARHDREHAEQLRKMRAKALR